MHGDGTGNGGRGDGWRLREVNEVVHHPLVLLLVRRRCFLEALLDDVQPALHQARGLHEAGVEHAHVDALAGEFALEPQRLAQSLYRPFGAHVAVNTVSDTDAEQARVSARTHADSSGGDGAGTPPPVPAETSLCCCSEGASQRAPMKTRRPRRLPGRMDDSCSSGMKA